MSGIHRIAKTSLTYVIRSARRKDIPQALKIWKELGMNAGVHSLETWMEIDSDGYKVAATPEGEILGSCGATFNHEEFAFGGMYMIRKEYQGQGIGIKLWKACNEHIGNRNCGLNAVPGKLELYRDRGGFPIVENDWSCLSFRTNNDVDVSVLKENVSDMAIIPISEDLLPKVIDYDHYVVGFKRDRILRLTIHEEDSVSFAAVDAEGRVRGYGVHKVGIQENGMVGPLYADSQGVAEDLLRTMILSLPQAKGLVLNFPDSNPGAKDIAQKLGIPEHTKCTRCYMKTRIHADLTKIFCFLDTNFSLF